MRSARDQGKLRDMMGLGLPPTRALTSSSRLLTDRLRVTVLTAMAWSLTTRASLSHASRVRSDETDLRMYTASALNFPTALAPGTNAYEGDGVCARQGVLRCGANEGADGRARDRGPAGGSGYRTSDCLR